MTDTKNLLANASSQCPFCPFLSHICHQYPEKNPVLAWNRWLCWLSWLYMIIIKIIIIIIIIISIITIIAYQYYHYHYHYILLVLLFYMTILRFIVIAKSPSLNHYHNYHHYYHHYLASKTFSMPKDSPLRWEIQHWHLGSSQARWGSGCLRIPIWIELPHGLRVSCWYKVFTKGGRTACPTNQMATACYRQSKPGRFMELYCEEIEIMFWRNGEPTTGRVSITWLGGLELAFWSVEMGWSPSIYGIGWPHQPKIAHHDTASQEVLFHEHGYCKLMAWLLSPHVNPCRWRKKERER